MTLACLVQTRLFTSYCRIVFCEDCVSGGCCRWSTELSLTEHSSSCQGSPHPWPDKCHHSHPVKTTPVQPITVATSSNFKLVNVLSTGSLVMEHPPWARSAQDRWLGTCGTSTKALMAGGFSIREAQAIVWTHRNSTGMSYDTKEDSFTAYCKARGWEPV